MQTKFGFCKASAFRVPIFAPALALPDDLGRGLPLLSLLPELDLLDERVEAPSPAYWEAVAGETGLPLSASHFFVDGKASMDKEQAEVEERLALAW